MPTSERILAALLPPLSKSNCVMKLIPSTRSFYRCRTHTEFKRKCGSVKSLVAGRLKGSQVCLLRPLSPLMQLCLHNRLASYLQENYLNTCPQRNPQSEVLNRVNIHVWDQRWISRSQVKEHSLYWINAIFEVHLKDWKLISGSIFSIISNLMNFNNFRLM